MPTHIVRVHRSLTGFAQKGKGMMQHIQDIGNRIINGGAISFDEAYALISLEKKSDYDALVDSAHKVFLHYCGNGCDLCSLVNAKSGLCAEDCAFCAQSIHFNTQAREYALCTIDDIVARAQEAEKMGAQRFCIVTSGGHLSTEDFKKIRAAFCAIKEKTHLGLDGSLGILQDDEIEALKEVGVNRINHNLETSERFFPSICLTHTFRDRYTMVERLKRHGMEVCSGGIIGLGEERIDRISLAFSLKALHVDCVPINILNPRPGTPLEKAEKLSVQEIITTIAVFRLILPRAVIKIAGGREVNLGNAQKEALQAGANGIIIGGYLVTQGSPFIDDLALIHSAGLVVKQ